MKKNQRYLPVTLLMVVMTGTAYASTSNKEQISSQPEGPQATISQEVSADRVHPRFQRRLALEEQSLDALVKKLDEYANLSYVEIREKGTEIGEVIMAITADLSKTKGRAPDQEIQIATNSLKKYYQHYAHVLKEFKQQQ